MNIKNSFKLQHQRVFVKANGFLQFYGTARQYLKWIESTEPTARPPSHTATQLLVFEMHSGVPTWNAVGIDASRSIPNGSSVIFTAILRRVVFPSAGTPLDCYSDLCRPDIGEHCPEAIPVEFASMKGIRVAGISKSNGMPWIVGHMNREELNRRPTAIIFRFYSSGIANSYIP